MRQQPSSDERKFKHRQKKHPGQTYVLSGKAQDVLSAVIEGILEESLEEAMNMAVVAGKSSVTREEIERALKKLCLRLHTATCLRRQEKTDTSNDPFQLANSNDYVEEEKTFSESNQDTTEHES